MADTRDFLLEEIKHLLKDVYDFLNVTLKKEKLKKDVNAKKDDLSQEINSVIEKVDNILPKDDQEEYADVEVSHDAPPIEEDGELYEDTAIPDSPNKNVMSQGSEKEGHEEVDPADADEAGEPYSDMKVGPIAATDLHKPTMEGFLDKRRKEGQLGLSQWQRRYCVVKENIFYYFKNRNDKQQKNVIILNGYEARPNPDFDKKNKKKDFLFELVCPAKRSFQFIASSNEEMTAWINAVSIASNFIPPPEPALKNSPVKDVPEQILEDFDETYDDVDTYPKAKVGPVMPETTQNADSGDIYDDTELEIIDTDEVYEDVASQELEHRRIPPPPQGALPDVPPHSPAINRPSMKLPAIPTPDRPTPLRRASVESKNSQNTTEESVPMPEPWEDDYSNIYVGMWDCNAEDENELEFKRGDLIHIISKEYDSFKWWVAEKNSKVGLVPKEYLMMAYVI